MERSSTTIQGNAILELTSTGRRPGHLRSPGPGYGGLTAKADPAVPRDHHVHQKDLARYRKEKPRGSVHGPVRIESDRDAPRGPCIMKNGVGDHLSRSPLHPWDHHPQPQPHPQPPLLLLLLFYCCCCFHCCDAGAGTAGGQDAVEDVVRAEFTNRLHPVSESACWSSVITL